MIMDAAFLGLLYAPPTYADADVNAYITAVELADGGGSGSVPVRLGAPVRDEINTLITAIKSDNEWANINTLVMIGAARTLAGAQIAMKGTNTLSYTNVTTGDYVRGVGILGNGVNKYGDSGVQMTDIGSSTTGFIGALGADYTNQSTGQHLIGRRTTSPTHNLAIFSANTIAGRMLSTSALQSSPALVNTDMLAVSTARAGGNIRSRGRGDNAASTSTSAQAVVAPTASNTMLLMVQDETLTAPWRTRFTGYVMGASSDSLASIDTIMTRLITFANNIRALLGT